MKKRYLVTGGTGFIGSAITKKLVMRGEKVRVLDNDFRGSKDRLKDIKKDFEFIKGDIRNIRVVEKACKGIDVVLHLAFINGTEFFYTMPELVLDVGVKGVVNVVDACIKNNIGNLVVASSSEVYQALLGHNDVSPPRFRQRHPIDSDARGWKKQRPLWVLTL